ncbi:class I SAM-dependent methyltransferase [Streptomyces sp. NPDC001288]|uniref:class I SAM-dependent methyltransferase n=1 Tax=unclassified Streptomyces TaxID=2593676 RepID=UPI0033173187
MSDNAQGAFTDLAGDLGLRERAAADKARPHRTPPAEHGVFVPGADRLAHTEPGVPWTADPYSAALRAGRGALYLRRLEPEQEGVAELLPLDVERFCAVPDTTDMEVLRRCAGPVLDVGCGPGRMVSALARQGVPALGVDINPAAVARARQRGGTALRQSVFDRLPREGRWGTVLLMDGNVGIGGDPAALLARLREVSRPGGRLLAETAAEDVDERLTVRIEDGQGRYGRPFPWARVGATAVLYASDATGWILTGRWSSGGRSFLELHRPPAVTGTAHPPDGEGQTARDRRRYRVSTEFGRRRGPAQAPE